MKKLRMITMCLLAMMATSLSVKAQEVTITLMPGWNWISVPLMDTLDFQTAMGTVTPVDGDIIKSHWGSAAYSNGQWRGTISQFYPGYGYHYKSNRTMPVFLTFTVQQPAPNNAPTGAINGLFTINANDDQVYFSQGNLQYQASTNTWRFAENQWDYIGEDNANISSTYDDWIDLFGWGTSGYHDTIDPYNVNYQPWSISNFQVYSSYNYYGYGPSTNMTDPNLIGTSANYDWGVYNPISNGGNQTNQWRTLSKSEWSYVFNTRSTTSGIRYAKAQVNGVNGVILLPDNWSTSTYVLNSTNTYDASFISNIVSSAQWDMFENAGAVFMPAAGFRFGTSVANVGSSGSYWSASFQNKYFASYMNFHDSHLGTNGTERSCGQSVRLVCAAEN